MKPAAWHSSFFLRANTSTLGQLAGSARWRIHRNDDSVSLIEGLACGFTRTVKGGLVLLASVWFCFPFLGCDLPERPPLPSTHRGSRIDLDDIEAVRRAAGLPVQTIPDPVGIAAPRPSDRTYAIKTSAISPGGAQLVGQKRSRVDLDPPSPTSPEAWFRGESDEWTEGGKLPNRFTRDDQAPEDWRSDEREPDNRLRRKVVSEELWIRRNRCSVLVRNDFRELMESDGRLRELAFRHQFGPIFHGVIAKADSSEGDPSELQLRFGFGQDAKAPHWRQSSMDWNAVDRGLLAMPDAVFELLQKSKPSATPVDTQGKNSDAPTSPDVAKTQFVSLLLPDSSLPSLVKKFDRVGVEIAGDAVVPFSGKIDKSSAQPMTEITTFALLDPEEESSPAIREVYWANPEGVIVRKLRGDGLLESLVDSPGFIDLPPRPNGGAALLIGGVAMDPDQVQTVAIRIAGDPDAIPTGPGQAVRRGEGVVELLLTRSGKVNDSFETWKRDDATADISATRLANFNQASMRRWTQAASSARTDNLPEALQESLQEASGRTREGVDHHIARDSLSITKSMLESRSDDWSFLPADQVIEQGAGGPLARSIVLLTLLRGRGISATLAMGVKAPGPLGENDRWLGFHVWVIAELEDQWYTLDLADDGQRSQELVSVLPRADRILLATCAPLASEIESAMVRTINLMSSIEVEIAGVR